jgi:TolB-like protein
MRRAVVAAWCLLSMSVMAAPPVSVAVLYFDYDGANDEVGGLRKGLTQMLITDLAGRESYTVVERARLQDVLAELNLGKTQKLDPASALKVGRLLQARYVVVGGYFLLAGALRVDARVYEVETSATLKGLGATGTLADVFAIEQKLAADLDAVLTSAVAAKGAVVDPPAPRRPAKSSKGALPAKAVAWYSKALQALDDKDPATAKKQLQAVVEAHPDFLLARLDLASLAK